MVNIDLDVKQLINRKRMVDSTFNLSDKINEILRKYLMMKSDDKENIDILNAQIENKNEEIVIMQQKKQEIENRIKEEKEKENREIEENKFKILDVVE